MKKNLIYILIVLVLIVLLVLINRWHRNTRGTASESFKIGAILPLTGDYGSLGEEINRGADIAVSEAKQQGMNLTYISEDDGAEPSKSASAASKLVRVDRSDAMFTAIVQEAKPVVPIINEGKTPLLVTWDSNNFLKSAGPYTFSIGFSTEAAGEAMAVYAYNELGLKRVAVIGQIDEWSDLISDAFSKKFVALGGSILMSEKAQITQKDFRTLLTKAKGLNPDGIYFPLPAPTAISPFLMQAKQLGIKSALMSGDGFTQDAINDARAAADGAYFTNIYADNTSELVKKYQQAYNRDPYYPEFVSFGYDAVKTLIAAKNIATQKNISLRDAITMVDIQGTGTHIFMNGTQFSERQEKIYKVVKGKIILAP